MDNQKALMYVVGVLVAGLLIGNFVSGQAVRKGPGGGGGGCSDSDGGQNIFVKGTVTSSSQGSAVDVCNSVNNIKEYYCYSKSSWTSANMPCPNGYACSNGACTLGTTTTITYNEYELLYDNCVDLSYAGNPRDTCVAVFKLGALYGIDDAIHLVEEGIKTDKIFMRISPTFGSNFPNISLYYEDPDNKIRRAISFNRNSDYQHVRFKNNYYNYTLSYQDSIDLSRDGEYTATSEPTYELQSLGGFNGIYIYSKSLGTDKIYTRIRDLKPWFYYEDPDNRIRLLDNTTLYQRLKI